jgi:replicative DNA helicase
MSVEAQQTVLGALLQKSDLMDDCYLQSADFTDVHQTIFKMLQWAYEHHSDKPDPFDIVLLMQEWGNEILNVGGGSYLRDLKDAVPTLSNFDYYQQLVRNSAIQRRAVDTLSEALHNGAVDIVTVKEQLESLQELQSQSKKDGMMWVPDILEGHHKEIMNRSTRSTVTGVKTASADFDEMSGGHQRKKLTIVGARPSIGKSAFFVADSLNAALSGYTVLMFSAEMPAMDVAERYICNISGIDNRKIQKGRLTENDWDSYSKALEVLDRLPIYIDDTPGMTIEYIWRQVKAMKKRFPNLIVYIDYLQLIDSEKRFSKTIDKVNYVSSKLKQLANAFDTPVSAISSVGRKCEERNDKRPMMSDLKESGNIEFDADIIIFLYRDDYYYPNAVLKGVIELIVAKGRSIGTGTIQMMFDRKNGRFMNLTQYDKEQLAEKVREHEQSHKRR